MVLIAIRRAGGLIFLLVGRALLASVEAVAQIEVFRRERFVTRGVSVVRTAEVDRYGRYARVTDIEAVADARAPVDLPHLARPLVVFLQHMPDLLIGVELHQKVDEKFEQCHLLQKYNIVARVDRHRDVFHSYLWHRHPAIVLDVWEALEVAGDLTL